MACRYNAQATRQRSGRIVDVASIAGKGYEGSYNAAYAASKGPVISLIKTAAQQLVEHNVNVDSVCPGETLTALSGANPRVRAQQEGVTLEDMGHRMVCGHPTETGQRSRGHRCRWWRS
jgi:NAD(P)-dependent dehydrogenase (short-subunit alcohol dehydrogenase family)